MGYNGKKLYLFLKYFKQLFFCVDPSEIFGFLEQKKFQLFQERIDFLANRATICFFFGYPGTI